MTPFEVKMRLLTWYAKNKRSLPWRRDDQTSPPPYHTYISEVMLQQTTVATVISYFERFVEHFPSWEKLSEANIQDVLKLWQGLGYYRRCHNLHACAIYVMSHGGRELSADYATLLKYPGIGTYTAKALCAIAFNQPLVPIDGNVLRIFSRVLALNDQKAKVYKHLESYFAPLETQGEDADFAQSLMDLGSLICRPHLPKCEICPLKEGCEAYHTNTTSSYPRIDKKEKRIRHGIALFLQHKDTFLIQEKKEGMLLGLYHTPLTSFDQECPLGVSFENLINTLNITNVTFDVNEDTIIHKFTHFELHLSLYKAYLEATPPIQGLWVPLKGWSVYPTSTLMKKIMKSLLLFS